jgi:hypothetical protein
MFAFMRLLLLAIALTACARASSTPAPAAYPDSYETIIAGGKIVDGTGNPWFYGDIGLSAGRIARITPAGMLARAQAARRIDARGLVVAPGVIDIQAHSEEQLLYGDSRVIGMTTQGVTTMIMGEGETPGQMSATMFADYLKSDDTTHAALFRTFIGPNGFGEWLRALRHVLRILPDAGRAGHDAYGGQAGDARWRLRRGERAHLPAGELRLYRGAHRAGEGDGAVRRRLHHAHALGG